MPFKKNIWFIYYAFLALGLVYLVASAYSRWEALKSDAVVELAYLNRILSSSLTLNFDQQVEHNFLLIEIKPYRR